MSKKDESPSPRPYRKRRRAAQEAETRRRITGAAVDLHGSIGPARTTISAVAARAGVQRATVYRHFADEAALFTACSAHWLEDHPLPDPATWEAIDDPDARLRAALDDLYRWFEDGEQMLEKVIRDRALVPSLAATMEGLDAWFGQVGELLVRDRDVKGAIGRRAGAVVHHALAFTTWRSLARDAGLERREVVDLMVRLLGVVVAGAGDGRGTLRS